MLVGDVFCVENDPFLLSDSSLTNPQVFMNNLQFFYIFPKMAHCRGMQHNFGLWLNLIMNSLLDPIGDRIDVQGLLI